MTIKTIQFYLKFMPIQQKTWHPFCIVIMFRLHLMKENHH